MDKQTRLMLLGAGVFVVGLTIVCTAAIYLDGHHQRQVLVDGKWCKVIREELQLRTGNLPEEIKCTN